MAGVNNIEACNGFKEIAVYLSWGGSVVDMENGVCTYKGGVTRCLWVREDMELNDICKKVEECMGEGLSGRKIWYSLKFNRRIMLLLDRPNDVVSFRKGNDDHGYLYVDGEGGPLLASNSVVHNNGNVVGAAECGRTNGLSNIGDKIGARNGNVVDAAKCGQKNRHTNFGDVTVGARAADVAMGEGGGGKSDCGEFDVSFGEMYDYSSDNASYHESGDEEGGVARSGSGLESDDYKQKMKNVIKGKGQVFANADSFRMAIWKYAVANKFEYKFKRNCPLRVAVACVIDGCQFALSATGGKGKEGMLVNRFQPKHTHNMGGQCEMSSCCKKRKIRAKLLAGVIDTKLKADPHCSPVQIMKDIGSEFNIQLSYKQAWRAKEYVHMMVADSPNANFCMQQTSASRVPNSGDFNPPL